MLLSKAEEDWRGQLRALRHAEWLIRAAPDELPQYAGGVGANVWSFRASPCCPKGWQAVP